MPPIPYRILSLDGGGIRGLLQAMILAHLEGRIQSLSGNDDAYLIDYVDLVAGTSTGSIMASGLLCPGTGTSPRFRPADLVALFENEGPRLFAVSRTRRIRTLWGLLGAKISPARLEALLEDKFGEHRMSQLLRPCLLTTFDLTSHKAVFPTQHQAPQAPDDQCNFDDELPSPVVPTKDYLVRDAVRASTAAPTYFPSARMLPKKKPSDSKARRGRFVDGGVFANNPAMCAFAEARKLRQCSPAEMSILSVGTGRDVPSTLGQREGLLSWARPLIDVVLDSSVDVVDTQLTQLFTSVGNKEGYLRLQPKEDVEVALGDASRDNLCLLRTIATKLIAARWCELEELACAWIGLPPEKNQCNSPNPCRRTPAQ